MTAMPPVRGAPLVISRWLLCHKLDQVLRARGVRVAWSHRLARVDVDGERASAEIDTLALDGAGYAYAVTEKIVTRSARHEPAFLIAADGDASVVRQQLAIHARATALPEVAASFEVAIEHDPGHEARIIVCDAATLAIWPLPGKALRLTFHLPAVALHGRRALGRDDLIALLREHTPDLRFRLGELTRTRLDFRVPAVAERANAGPVWLLGDAARALPLAASGSLNQGVRDAHAIAAALTQTLRDGAPDSLALYASSARRAAAAGMEVGATYRAAAHGSAYVAEHARRVLPHVPARGPDLDEAATKLGLAVAR
jgi:2-polyprenyl-6-methoxyphenol hydroxylase-like FAD-dependent oxidoreductase